VLFVHPLLVFLFHLLDDNLFDPVIFEYLPYLTA